MPALACSSGRAGLARWPKTRNRGVQMRTGPRCTHSFPRNDSSVAVPFIHADGDLARAPHTLPPRHGPIRHHAQVFGVRTATGRAP
jgi:hypothetical protein